MPVVLQYIMRMQKKEKEPTYSVLTFNFNTQLMLTAVWSHFGLKNAVFFYRFCKINLNYVCLTFAICSSDFVNEMKLATTNNFGPRCILFAWVLAQVCNNMMPEKNTSMRHDYFFTYFTAHTLTHTSIHVIAFIEWVKVHTPTFYT